MIVVVIVIVIIVRFVLEEYEWSKVPDDVPTSFLLLAQQCTCYEFSDRPMSGAVLDWIQDLYEQSEYEHECMLPNMPPTPIFRGDQEANDSSPVLSTGIGIGVESTTDAPNTASVGASVVGVESSSTFHRDDNPQHALNVAAHLEIVNPPIVTGGIRSRRLQMLDVVKSIHVEAADYLNSMSSDPTQASSPTHQIVKFKSDSRSQSISGLESSPQLQQQTICDVLADESVILVLIIH